MVKCFICGAGEDEVAKMHRFPTNINKSKIWQEKLGMRFMGENLRNYRICSKHFTSDSYTDSIHHKLNRNAVPMQFFNRPIASTSAMPEKCEESVSTSAMPEKCEESVSTSAMPEKCEESRLISSNDVPVHSDIPNIMISDAKVCSDSMELDQPQTPKQRGRIFRNISITSPRKKKLMKIIQQKEDHLRKLKKKCRQKSQTLRSVLELSDTPEVQNLYKNMPKTTWNFMMSQLRCSRVKDTRGRRWTIDDKILALLLLKKSPRCYKLLRSFVALPSRNTVLNLLKKVPLNAGINRNIFEHINENVKEDADRLCVLLFDEMDIKENLYFDKGQRRIIGFEDLGEGRTGKEAARKVLVFMVVGLNRKWKQPIAYYFTHKSCNSEILRNCLFECIEAVTNIAKLDIVATICDMGVNNVKCLKELGVTTQRPYFLYEGKQIFAMYDPPHLLKRTYALFRKYNVFLNVTMGERDEIMEAKFSHVRWAYEHDKSSPYVFRSLHKLKDHFFDPIMKYAMKVNIAAQVMSRTVSAYLYSMIKTGVMEQECIATAEFLMEVDTLFDSFNGNTNQSGKELKCNISENSPHLEYWPKAIQMVKNWEFKRLSKSGQFKQSKPPSQMGWITSLNAVRAIWAYVHSKGLTVLRPRSLNQDPLENLFGCIRFGSGCNDNPSAFQFVGSLKAQILNNLIHSTTHSNCEMDNNVLLSNLRTYLEKETKDEQSDHNEVGVAFNISSDMSTEETVCMIEADVNRGSTETFSVAYVAGFILKGIYKKISCTHCSSLLSSDELEPHNMYIWNKEWSENLSLYYPSISFTISIGHGITLLENFIENQPNISELPFNATRFLHENIDFHFLKCEEHFEEVEAITVQSIVNIGIGWWVKRKNQNFKNLKNQNIKCKKLKKIKNM